MIAPVGDATATENSMLAPKAYFVAPVLPPAAHAHHVRPSFIAQLPLTKLLVRYECSLFCRIGGDIQRFTSSLLPSYLEFFDFRPGYADKVKNYYGVKLNFRCFSMKTKSLQFTVHYILFKVLSFRSYDLCPSCTKKWIPR